jgi:ubiquinone/menaquinone biosynthesis C-methylase UbiE
MAAPSAFTGSIPETYHRLLGPLLFEPYARDLAARLRLREGLRVLELACGTGIVTRETAAALPRGAELVATDLNDAMLEVARRHVVGASGGAAGQVTLRQADAGALPFQDRSFDLLVCQFGVMFFPEKLKAMQEARRVLRAGGRYLFNVWDSLEHNPIPGTVHEIVAALFPANPPNFLKAAPYGYYDRAEIERVLRTAGFTEIACQTIDFPSVAPTAEDGARAFIEGTPLLVALQERGVMDTAPIVRAAAELLARRCGDHPCRSTMRALVFAAS